MLEALEPRLTPATMTITDLAQFTAPDGLQPQAGLIADSDGNLFGTTFRGGTANFGTLFEWVKSTGTIAVLANFNYTDGGCPKAKLFEDSSGNLFGTTTLGGGTSNAGTVFEWNKSTRTISVLAVFQDYGADSETAIVQDSSGNLFGTTITGSSNDGTLFEWVKSTGTTSVLAQFNGANGTDPQGNLVLDASGNLFGTTKSGGTSNDGTLFEWVKSTRALSVRVNFTNATGANPVAGLVEDSSGNLFGSTTVGGTGNVGTLFEWVKKAGTISVLANFDGQSNGSQPYLGFVDASGNIFGTTCYGGTGYGGTVFEWVKSSGTISTLGSFSNARGGPNVGLVEDSSGNLFGTTVSSLFEWDHNSRTISDLVIFDYPSGETPRAGVIEDGDGNLFGTTPIGGLYGCGTLFEWVKSTGSLSTLVNFDYTTNGENPLGGLIQDSSGNLFGTTMSTLFEWVKSTKTLVVLANFNDTVGIEPQGALVEDSSGNLFGTTFYGGTNDGGTVFEWVKSTGTISVLANFDNATGIHSVGGVIEDGSGNLFGTTSEGGSGNWGTVFEWVKSTGKLSVLANFNYTDGARPAAGLVEDIRGNLYGTTQWGGNAGKNSGGTVFEWVKSTGAITDLVTFVAFGPYCPMGPLVRDSNGDLFGTTFSGGGYAAGDVFEWVNSTRTVVDLADFDFDNGFNAQGPLWDDGNGNLFGTTWYGGSAGFGTIFEIQPADSTSGPSITSLGANSAPEGSTLTITGTGFTPSSVVEFNGVAALTTFISSTQLSTIVPDEGSYTVTVNDPSKGTSNGVAFTSTDAPLSGAKGVPVATAGTSLHNAVLATFTDTNPYAQATDFPSGNLVIDWGDGSATSNGGIKLISRTATGSTWEVLGSHAYRHAGKYTATVQIADIGGSATQATTTVKVPGERGIPLDLSSRNPHVSGAIGLFTDTNLLTHPRDYRAVIAWGDGSISDATLIMVRPGVFEVTGSHTYRLPGKYHLKITVTSNNDESSLSFDSEMVIERRGRRFRTYLSLKVQFPPHVTLVSPASCEQQIGRGLPRSLLQSREQQAGPAVLLPCEEYFSPAHQSRGSTPKQRNRSRNHRAMSSGV
jgi:uncharacterized repeat protein (TIGR03803 family)